MPVLNIIIALHCEAKPIIERLKLKKISNQALPFSIFTDKANQVNLIISGIGKIKAAIATTFLAQYTGNKSHACFLNIGIAGSSQLNISEVVLANKLKDESTQRNWYPFTGHLKFKKHALLITHDLPQPIYPEIGMVDMEASGFYQAATSFVTQEQVQILKIISDNSIESQQQINEEKVKALAQDKIDLIAEFISQLLQLSQQEKEINQDPLKLKEFLSQWHFTHAQSMQLKEYLRRWQIQVQEEDSYLFCQHEKNANQVIQKIITKLDTHANSLY